MKNALRKSNKLKFEGAAVYPIKPSLIVVTATRTGNNTTIDLLRDNAGNVVKIDLANNGFKVHRMDQEIHSGFNPPHILEASAVFMSFKDFNINDQKGICFN